MPPTRIETIEHGLADIERQADTLCEATDDVRELIARAINHLDNARAATSLGEANEYFEAAIECLEEIIL